MSKQINIGGRLHSTEQGNAVTGANEVLDDTKGKKQNVINADVDAELLRLDQSKQNNLTFDNTPTEDSTNPVTSGGVYAADKALSDAIEAILVLIPSAASALNQLADKEFVNSTEATNTATFRGTSATGLTEQQFLDWADSLTHDKNDYVFWQTIDAAGNTLFKRYKYDGTQWLYEYTLNNSSFTADQWAAIMSGITAALVEKLQALPTATEIQTALDGKQATLTFDNVPVSGSDNPVKSGGVFSQLATKQATLVIGTNYDANPTENSTYPVSSGGVWSKLKEITDLIPAAATNLNQLSDKTWVGNAIAEVINALDATISVNSSDGHVGIAMTQVDGKVTQVVVSTNDIASASALSLLGGRVTVNENAISSLGNRMTTAEGNITTINSNITSLTGRVSTNETDIANLQQLYNDLQQSKPVPVTALPETGQQQGVIYRLAGTTSYSDYMWNGSTWVLMATYNNAIDDEPTAGSDNLVKSGAFGSLTNAAISIALSDDLFEFPELIGNDGTITENDNRKTTDYIKVNEGATIVYSALQGNPSYRSIACYDQNKFYVSEYSSSQGNGSMVIPSIVKYIKASAEINSSPDVKITNVLATKQEIGKNQHSVSTVAGVILDWSYPNVYESSYRTSDFIPVSEGDIVSVGLAVGTNAYVMTGYSQMTPESAIPEFRELGSSSDYITQYSWVIPKGVNFIRVSCSPEFPVTEINYSISKSEDYKITKVIKEDIGFLKTNYNRFAKYPSTSPRKACVVFQMDGSNILYPNVFDYENLLKEYDVPFASYLVLPYSLSDYEAKVAELYKRGNEVSVHGEYGIEINDNTIQGYLQNFSNFGIIPFGFIGHGTQISSSELLIARKYFSWIVKQGGDYMSYNDNNYLDSVMSLNDNIYEFKRLSIEILHDDYETVKETAIQNVKNAIDKTIQDRGVLCLYGHSYNQLSSTTYTIYPYVLTQILSYLKTKIQNGIVVTGNTADIVEYYWSKRYNE